MLEETKYTWFPRFSKVGGNVFHGSHGMAAPMVRIMAIYMQYSARNCTTQTQCICCANKKHLKNVGTIRDCEPPHAHSPGVATGTVARRLRIDVHDANDDNNNDDNDNA